MNLPFFNPWAWVFGVEALETIFPRRVIKADPRTPEPEAEPSGDGGPPLTDATHWKAIGTPPEDSE